LGRAAARLALTELGFEDPPPILRGAGREPLWPGGIVGSITHCGPWAIAAVANNQSIQAIGIDLEEIVAVPYNEISNVVCSEVERDWVFGGRDTRLRLAMLFSAKEAIYKALYPLCQKFFDFHAAELTWFPQRSCFLGKLCTDLSAEFPKGFSFEVDCRRRANFVFTHATIEAHSPTTADEQESSAT
jgi:4'-phosphopantetheinyl transferase EntD